jgi:hypothetical protein
MFNTTTEPTQIQETTLAVFLHITSILSISMVIGASMIELFLYRLREKEREESDSVEEESETNETDLEEEYCEKYCEEFEALAMRDLSEEELKNLNTKIVRETVSANVDIIMTFDKSTDTFWYYTDHLKEVSYAILETVARKYALAYDCKKICLSEPVTEPATDIVNEPEPANVPSVFAKFKKYNTGGKGSAPNFTSVIKVIEQMNHFRYRGKLYDYEESQKLTKKISEAIEPVLDYATYKNLMEKKEN